MEETINCGRHTPPFRNYYFNENNFIKWVINCSLGELLGIGIAGSMAVALNYWIDEPQTPMQKVLVLFIMLLAGGRFFYLLVSMEGA